MDEKEKAKRLLEHKKNGFSYRLTYRGMRNRYFLYLTSILILLYLATQSRENAILYILVGLFIGTFLRDYSWIKAMKLTWSFTEKIIDWEKVKQIANCDDEK